MLLWLATVRSIMVLPVRAVFLYSNQPHQSHGVFVGVAVERIGGRGSG